MFTHFFKELLKDCKEGHEAIFDNDFLKYLKKMTGSHMKRRYFLE